MAGFDYLGDQAQAELWFLSQSSREAKSRRNECWAHGLTGCPECTVTSASSWAQGQLDGVGTTSTHSAGWTGTWKPAGSERTYTWTPKPVTNREKWNKWLSIEHAKSRNPAARAIGLRRDRQRGYHSCVSGRHWGPWGAAGILAYVVDEHGRIYVAMSLRAKWVQEGGTWSTFGGAIERGERAYVAAEREADEEVDGLVFGERDVVAEVTEECPHGCGWSYTTFVVRADMWDGHRLPRLGRVKTGSKAAFHGAETSGYAWVPIAQVEDRKLHSGFARTWAHNRQVIETAELIKEARA